MLVSPTGHNGVRIVPGASSPVVRIRLSNSQPKLGKMIAAIVFGCFLHVMTIAGPCPLLQVVVATIKPKHPGLCCEVWERLVRVI